MLKTSVWTEAKWIFVCVGLFVVLRVTVTGCPTRTSMVGTLVQVSIIRYSSLLIAIVPQFPRITCLEQVPDDDGTGISPIRAQMFETEFSAAAVFVATLAAMLTVTVYF